MSQMINPQILAMLAQHLQSGGGGPQQAAPQVAQQAAPQQSPAIPPVVQQPGAMDQLLQAVLNGTPQPAPNPQLSTDPTVDARLQLHSGTHSDVGPARIPHARPAGTVGMSSRSRGGVIGPDVRESIPDRDRDEMADFHNGTGEYSEGDPNMEDQPVGSESGGKMLPLGTRNVYNSDKGNWERQIAPQQPAVPAAESAQHFSWQDTPGYAQKVAAIAASHQPSEISEQRGDQTQTTHFDDKGIPTQTSPLQDYISKSGLNTDQQNALTSFASQPGVTPEQVQNSVNSLSALNQRGANDTAVLDQRKKNEAAELAQRQTAEGAKVHPTTLPSNFYDQLSKVPNVDTASVTALKNLAATGVLTPQIVAQHGLELIKSASETSAKNKRLDDLINGTDTSPTTQPTTQGSSPQSNASVPVNPAALNAAPTQPQQASAAPVGILSRLLMQRQAQPLQPGMTFKQGQFVRVGNKIHRVVGFDKSGGPLFTGDLLGAQQNA
jgi:hypothetical protein